MIDAEKELRLLAKALPQSPTRDLLLEAASQYATLAEALTARQQERDAFKQLATEQGCFAAWEEATEDARKFQQERASTDLLYAAGERESIAALLADRDEMTVYLKVEGLQADLTACRAQGEAMRAKVLAYARAYHATEAVLQSAGEDWPDRMTAAATAQEDAQIDLIAYADAALSSTPTEPKSEV